MPANDELNALRARLERYATDRDPDVLLHPAALADLLALSAALQDRFLEDPGAAAALGTVHWQRSLLLPEPDDRDDLRAALAVFTKLASSRPDLVPPEVLGFMGSDEHPDGEGPTLDDPIEDELRVDREPSLADDPQRLEQIAAVLRVLEPAGMAEPSVTLLGDVVTRFARYIGSGQPEAVDESIALVSVVVSNPETSDVLRSAAVDVLTGLLLVRYQIHGRLADLDIVIAHGRKVSRGGTSVNLTGRLSNLGLALRARFERTGRAADLDESIAVHRRAVALTPATDPERSRYLSNLGLALRLRFEHRGEPTDLSEAVAVTRQAIESSPPGDPDSYRYLTNLGVALRERYESQGAPEDLDEAIRSGRAAVVLLPDEHPDRAGVMLNLGGSLLAAAKSRADDLRLIEAVEVLQEAVRHAAVIPTLRALAATHLGRAAAIRRDWHLASNSFETAISAIDLIVRHGHRSDSEFHLARFAGLASDATASALQAGDPQRAAELWEYGHGVLIRHALDQRSEVEAALAAAAPALAQRLAELRQPNAEARLSARYQEWTELVAQIRMLPGFENFLRPVSARELTAAAAEGPIVLVNVSAYRSDAIALTANDIKIIPLPGIDPDNVRMRHYALNHAVSRHADWEAGDHLSWLWDTIAGPVLEGLGLHTRPRADQEWPRLWWCPSGPLAFLPLHMAGYHDRQQTVLDRVVSSYTPTVRALIDARRRSPRPLADSRVLAVGLTEVVGAPRLPEATSEARNLAQRFPDNSTVLTDSQATADAVLKALPVSDWLHFACHGQVDTAEPSTSGLLLSDRMLTIRDLVDLHVSGQFVFLSACKTAVGEALPDESVNLAAAFLIAGYRNVLGSLWPILDNTAPQIADAFYTALTSGPNSPARALHLALRAMRDRHPDRPLAWAATIHVGP
ncbi:CHAT domain-containing protein [Micromonospora sp. RL09-050-HVF-A]|uniref:CHAT domain-containing protein n=1 Tax=Micromonospora sp. RL09-050-HVF-A TaxID=1703433 RepID=UPI001C5CE52E|nr:CHAT domain-containing protein [Micromonospora sp. RL09-050-HVF-A]MBW4705199.1 CHAT domain-containing protein [Micromonospora sp. RL09-050-HVF-A]